MLQVPLPRGIAISALGLALLLPFAADAQVPSLYDDRGPAAQDSSLADRVEPMHIVGTPDTGGLTPFDFRVFDCVNPGLVQGEPCTLDTDLLPLEVSSQVQASASTSPDTQLATATGRFDPFLPGGDQVVFATATVSDVVFLRLCSNDVGDPCAANPNFLSESNIAARPVVAIFGDNGIEARRFVQLAAAQLDRDPLDELVLAYWREDGDIAVEVFDWDPETGTRSRYVLPASDRTSLDPTLFRSARLALAAADFEGNLLDTIAIVTPDGPEPLPFEQTNDFERFRVDFFELLVSSNECPDTAPCLVGRGSDVFEQHRFEGTPVGSPPEVFNHMTRFFNGDAAGRPVGCQVTTNPAFPLDCYLTKLEATGARLTPSPSVGASFERALPENLVVLADFVYDSDNFRQSAGDLFVVRPARCGSPPEPQAGICPPAADALDFYLAGLPACDDSAANAQYPQLVCAPSSLEPTLANALIRHVDLPLLGDPDSIDFLGRTVPQNIPICLAAGDLASGPLEEIAVFRSVTGATVFDVTLDGAEIQDLTAQAAPVLGQYVPFAGIGREYVDQGDCALGIVDLDGDPGDTSSGRLSSWDRELVAVSVFSTNRWEFTGFETVVSFTHRELVDVWRVNLSDPDGDFLGLTLAPASRQTIGNRTAAQLRPAPVVAASFPDWDDDALSLGPGNVVLDQSFSQPTLVLNAPPRHLDLLDELENPPACLTEPLLDVNWTQCNVPEPDGSCDGLVTSYSVQMSESYGSRIENTVTRSVGGGFSVGPFGASVERKYTDTDITSGGDTLVQTQFQDADYVDTASTSVTGYRVYEYEVFLGDEKMMDESSPPRPVTVAIVRTDPGSVGQAPVLSNPLVLPRHVPGNLLSYKPLDYYQNTTGECCTLGSPSQQQLSYNAVPVTLGVLADGGWSLLQNVENGTESTTSGSLVFQAGGSASYYGVGVSFSGSYDSSTATTHTTDVSSQVRIGWSYTDESSSATLPYTVTPFVRVDPTGAVVLDYAVDIIDDPKDPSCLRTVYSLRSDPAISLPRRRSFALYGDEIRNGVQNLQTKELACAYEPSTESFTLQARLHNYSLLESPATEVEFWLGDPREPSNDAVLLASTVAPPIAPQDDDLNPSATDVFAVDAVLAAFICDGEGVEPEGTPCLNSGDDEAECGVGGACVPTLGSPYGVCNLVSAEELVGTRCQEDADCGADAASKCVPENRLFVRVDPGDVVSELSEDNNLGWRFLDEGCLPEQTAPVPEPGAVLSMAAALATLAAIRRRRRGSRRL